MFQNNICPTCRQKIICREDPDPEEYDFEFDSGFLTDIIREINNIVYGVDSDEEFLYSDSPDIIDLSSSDNETVLLEEQSTRNERNGTSQDTESNEEDVDNEVLPSPCELESDVIVIDETDTIILSDVSSGEETQDYQNMTRSVKRRMSLVEVEDSSDDEDSSDTVRFPQDVNRNPQNTLSSQNAQPIKESIPYSVNRNNPVGSRKKLRKRQRRSPESEESQFSQDSSDEDFEFRNTCSTDVYNRKNEEKKQTVNEKETSEGPSSNINSADESHDDESENGVLVFDMVEVESLVSKLLEIMNQGEDESNPNEDEEVVESCPEECSERSVLVQENKGSIEKSENSDDEYGEAHSIEDSTFCLSDESEVLSKSVELISDDRMNINVPSDKLTVERNPSPCQRKGKSVKRKISSSCSSDSESAEGNDESPVKRKASSSDSESSDDDDSDGYEKIEQIISELWSIVGGDEEESESDQNGAVGAKNCNSKNEQNCLQNKESPKRHKRNPQPIFQGKNN